MIPVYLAVLQVTCATLFQVAAAAPATSSPESGPHRLQKRLATGSIIAIGICVPAVVLVLGLGIGILWFYPEQRRKLRAQNARRAAALANQTNGRERQRQGSGHTTLPAYKEHEGSEHELEDVADGDVPAVSNAPTTASTVQPGQRLEAQPPTDARHAALTV